MTKTTISQQWNGKDVKIKGKRVVGKTAFEVGLVVEGQAKLLAPVNWGYLAASITTQSRTTGTEPDAPTPGTQPKGEPMPPSRMKIQPPVDENEVLVGTPVEYAPWVEFGTSRTEAQPFLRPAFDLAKGKTLSIGLINGRYQFKDYLQ